MMLWFLVTATPVRAWHPPETESARLCGELQRGPSNKIGFTVGDLFDPKLWVGVKHPQQFHPLDQIDDNIHRVPRPGVQFELLTPGDTGITIHFRW